MSEFNTGDRVKVRVGAFPADDGASRANGLPGTVRVIPENANAQSDWPYYLVELDNDELNLSERGLGRGVWLASNELEALND